MGYVNETVEDQGTYSFITEFERHLPLRHISLVEFERRIKKLVTPAMKDSVSVGMLIECFQDHWAFEEIGDRKSFVYNVMFDPLFLAAKQPMDSEAESESGDMVAELDSAEKMASAI